MFSILNYNERQEDMKGGILVMLFIVFPLLTKGQWFYFEIGDTLTIIAKSGVNLRDSSSSNSKRIGTVSFGEKVIAKGIYERREVFDNRHGGWIKVEFKGIEGYLFSGFVSRLSIPKFDDEKIDCYSVTSFEEIMRANVDTLLCKGEKLYKGFDPDGKDWGSTKWEMFTNGTVIYHAFGYEHEDLIIETAEMTMNDVLNLIEFYVSKLKNCDYKGYTDKSDYFEDGTPKISIIKDDEGYIKMIECFPLNFIAEKSIHKTIIRLNLWSL